jgi:nucleotide-binding universal stress UspA family protein
MSTVEQIEQAIERLGVDAICLSSHGRSGVSKVLAGSVAQTVMEGSRHPLVVIRPPRAE